MQGTGYCALPCRSPIFLRVYTGLPKAPVHPLLWPASSVLVDGNAVYAFTPDGRAYNHRRN